MRSVVTTGLQARLLERQTMVRTRRRRRGLMIAGVALALLAVLWVIFFSPVLALDQRQVSITGTADTVDVKSVEKLVQADVGTPLPRLGTVALRDQIKDVRGVRDVSIRRRWPRGLSIVITARAAVVAVPQGDSGFVLLDSDAVRVGRSNKAPSDLPVMKIPLDGGRSHVLDSVLSVVNALPSKLRHDIAKISAKTQDAITFELRDKTTVAWGGSQDTALKSKVLQTLRRNVDDDTVTHFDVSAPTAPVTR